MRPVLTALNEKLFNGINPYLGFDRNEHPTDMQGWNSHHLFLSDSVVKERPRIVVEIGVWKGGSTIHMAETMRNNQIDGVVLAVDTFLGSWEHYEQAEFFPSLRHVNGYPSMFYTFLTNVLHREVEDFVQPLPLDSANAFHVLSRKGIAADLIHIDAGHDFDAVLKDLEMWWQILRPGALMITDDYDEEGVVWPSVRDAVKTFLKNTPHNDFSAIPYKARFRKPLEL